MHLSVTVWLRKFYVSPKKDTILQKKLGVGPPGNKALCFYWPLLLEKVQKAQVPCIPPFSC